MGQYSEGIGADTEKGEKMGRYIDAEKLEKDGWSASRTYPQDAHTMVYETKKMTDFPTADVAEVVRCKDCKYLYQEASSVDELDELSEFADHVCTYWDSDGLELDDFCSQGERRGDET